MKRIVSSEELGLRFTPFLLVALLMGKAAIGQVTNVGSNGYSSVGVVPSSEVLPTGRGFISYDSNIPGAKNTSGYNTQIGLGLYSGLELVGRLATNDQRCNMFVVNACPPGNIRDFSASFKWQLQNDWLKQNDAKIAAGMTDVGGAASFFRSYYVVGSKSWDNFEIGAGKAKASGPQAFLSGAFASAAYRPNTWSELSVQNVGRNSWMTVTAQTEIPNTQLNAYLSLNRRITDTNLTEKNWVGVGVSVPMDQGLKKKSPTAGSNKQSSSGNKEVKAIEISELISALEQKGFYNTGVFSVGKNLMVEVENTAYQWNVLDAAGVAMGVIVGVNTEKNQNFDLLVKSRGISQLRLRGEISCVRRWLEFGEVCSNLTIESSLQASGQGNEKANEQGIFGLGTHESWHFRPELILSPTVVSSIGTEYGSFDMDLGANVNVLLPLWAGATLDTNRVVTLGVGTRGFEQGGVFYGARLKPVTSRTMLHQIVSLPTLNTQLRLSTGTAYTNWQGTQLEGSTQSMGGRHRVSFASGSFKSTDQGYLPSKQYGLLTYRYANDDQMNSSTEMTKGKFWGGDSGWSVGQRFWHGDTSINLYLRRTRMSEFSPLVSFAGIQLSLPITPRGTRGYENAAIRGVNQWTYALESRVLDKTNTLTGGYGEVPRMGESLLQTFNRDRTSTRYLESNLSRLKSAFNEVSGD